MFSDSHVGCKTYVVDEAGTYHSSERRAQPQDMLHLNTVPRKHSAYLDYTVE
jgi:hypothetical protein